MSAQDLLVEIGTEELPPKALRKLANAFADGVHKGLKDAQLTPGTAHVYASPRRLAVLVNDVAAGQEDRTEQRRGPAVKAAFDKDGNPSKAAEGFARSCNTTIDKLDRLKTDKGEWLCFDLEKKGQSTEQLLPGIVESALAALPIPKRMRWGDSAIEFLRPVHWCVMLLGTSVVDATILGIRSGRETRGHRFHHPEPISLASPTDYLSKLEQPGYVIADMDKRRDKVRQQAEETATSLGGHASIEPDLLDEVSALVEWPMPIHGEFDTAFLELPAEALISSMQDHQKYFPVLDADGKLMAHFITIANIDSKDPDKIRRGNERVIFPRLSDSRFFWDQDLKRPLADSVDKLKTIVFQQKLGTVFEKSQRVRALAITIGEQISANTEHCGRAADLAKCDLVTSMVGEFPDLQGIMGRYYAKRDEHADVATAIDEHYMPRFAGDALPQNGVGQAVALSDRLDTLAGIFSIGQPPTGDKDPFALRRAAIGTLRIFIECGLKLDLFALIKQAVAQQPNVENADELGESLFGFLMERLRAYYVDQGIPVDSYDAVLSCRPTQPLDFDQRIHAVQSFRTLPECAALAAANKRIRNILKKTKDQVPTHYDPNRFIEDAEGTLASSIESVQSEVGGMIEARQYGEALTQLAGLRTPVDRFFDDVMVMADDDAIRLNRLALLSTMSNLFLQIADLSQLQS